MVCPPSRKIIHPLKFVDYFLIQVDKSWFNCIYYYNELHDNKAVCLLHLFLSDAVGDIAAGGH